VAAALRRLPEMNDRTRLIDFVPEMYRAILPELFDQPVAEERNATCDRCAMCPPEVPLFAPDEYFNPKTKCCTYHPALPNFAVGGLLQDESGENAEGRRRIRAAIARRIGVTPLGIQPPPKQRVLYRNGKLGFGRANALSCPYLELEAGRCSVWRYREAVCTTWFCKHNSGQDGLAFWQQLRDYLLGTQSILCVYVLRTLGFDVDRITDSTASDSELDERGLDDAPPEDAAYAALWHDWIGREEQLYRAAYDLLRAVDRETFERLAGIRHQLELDRLGKRHREMQYPALPAALLRNPSLGVSRNADGTYILVSYLGTDPIRVQKTVYGFLDYFDGRKANAEVRTAILMDSGQWISDSLLTKLYQYRILVDPAGSKRRLPTVT
jgi:hypothetical protein